MIWALVAAAGVALVIQNLIMVGITARVSTVIVTLLVNSAVGLVALTALLVWRNGVAGLAEFAATLRGAALLPGLLGAFVVFAGILGYQRLGAAGTVAVFVSSQLIAGLAADQMRAGGPKIDLPTVAGAALLIAGTVLILRRLG